MKNHLTSLFIVLLFLVTPVGAENPRQVLEDPTFSRGFILTGATHRESKRTETLGRKNVKPAWQIAQWHSKGKLDRIDRCERSIRLYDDFKSVTLDRETGAINLTLEASKEYEKPRTSASDPWVHLLLEQSPFREPVKIADAKTIWVEFDFELTRLQVHGKPDPGLHTAQVGWFLYLKNQNRESKGFHDFLWFGLSLFDARRDFTKLYAAQDFAMPEGRFIYTLGSESYLKEKVSVGKRHRVRFDILPEIQKALEVAHSRGFILHSTVADMSFDGTNIGWEIPGVYDVGITFHHLSIEVEKK